MATRTDYTVVNVPDDDLYPPPARHRFRDRARARLEAARWWRWELGTVIAFHGGLGVIIATAPEGLVVTKATWPMFAYLGRPGMAAFFLVVAAAAVACYIRPTGARQLATWLGVSVLGSGWIAGFVFALKAGDGGLYGLIIWTVLLAIWTSTAIRLGLRPVA